MYTREKEIRKLPSIQLYELAQILDLNDSWKKLMRIIPKNPFSNLPQDITTYKYNLDDERLIEKATKNQNRMGAEILFVEWGTSGRRRPTLGVLLELLARAQLFRAADLVAIKYLNEPPPARPSQGPAAKIDISIPLDSEIVHEIEDMLANGDHPGTETLNDNANPSRLADNNIDYYEKYTPNEKRLSISTQSNGIHIPGPSGVANNGEIRPQSQHTDLMKFSSSLASVTASQVVIPMLSDLLPSTSAQSNSNNSSATIAVDQQTSVDLPILSALNTQSSLGDIIPNLSALNVHDVAHLDNGDKSTTLKPRLDDLSPSTQSSTSISTISSSPDDDDNDLSAPNLSILDQRSSNNDSSLTNVTATSEDNSFEMSLNEGSTSYDNIPCLSALK
ncbi:protein Tube [Episyrphus balteatus]|uniref:protein Tube n=1 Tax=Episyrphus balteatus TaxID=286459 RepID=UPI00248686FE|nr:protein Tube [Episyrphus balteatus]